MQTLSDAVSDSSRYASCSVRGAASSRQQTSHVAFLN
jgi:hypothetical protein